MTNQCTRMWQCPDHPDQDVHLHCFKCGVPIFPRQSGDSLNCPEHTPKLDRAGYPIREIL